MKKVLVIAVVLLPMILHALNERFVHYNGDGTYNYNFYMNKNKVASETYSDDNVLLKRTGRIPDGGIIQYGIDWNIRFKYSYKYNLLEGISTEYTADGRKLNELNYKAGKLKGITKEYYASGALNAEWNYLDNKLEGETIGYYESGPVAVRQNYIKGKLNGKRTKYFKNGTVYSEEYYNNGKEINLGLLKTLRSVSVVVAFIVVIWLVAYWLIGIPSFRENSSSWGISLEL